MALARRQQTGTLALGTHALAKSSVESFYSCDDSDSASIMAKTLQSRPARSGMLWVQTDTPIKSRHRRYQSDEEVPSPGMEEDFSEGHDSAESEGHEDGVSIDESIDLDSLEPLTPAMPLEQAQPIRIVFTGKPSLINVHRIAPMAARRRCAAVDEGKSQIPPVPIPRRSSRRRNNGTVSLYDPPVTALLQQQEQRPETIVAELQPFTFPTQAPHYPLAAEPAGEFQVYSSGSTSTSARSSATSFSIPYRFAIATATAATAIRPRPQALHSSPCVLLGVGSNNSSISSSPPSLMSHGPSSPTDSDEHMDDVVDAEGILAGSADFQVRTRSSERVRQFALLGSHAVSGGYDEDDSVMDQYHYNESSEFKKSETLEQALEGPTPTTYDAYDPYGVHPPSLRGLNGSASAADAGRRGSATTGIATSVAKKGWMGWARTARRGRRDAVA